MNKLYSLLGIGLLSAATLSSCKEDAFIDGKDNVFEELQTYTAIGSILGYKASDKEALSRANVQDDGYSFMWNTNDKVTIWNGTSGYEFATKNYDESEPSNNVEFTGNGDLTDGSTVWGIYPKKDSPTADNIFTFTLGDATQTGSKPELQKTMHMFAKGTVAGNMISNLKFEHLTALYQFNITNRRPDSYKVTKVVVSCETAIFPTTLTVAGEEKTFTEKVKSLTLSLDDLVIAKDGTASGYLSFFPIPDLTGDTELVFTVTIKKNGDITEDPETIEKKGKISELYNAESVVAKDGYKYVAGKRYGVSFNLIEELGYDITGENQYLVKKEAGLINLVNDASIMTNPATVITLNENLNWQNEGTWTPVAEFKGTLNGNGKNISNITIGTVGTSAGLFVLNTGKIENLTLENITLNSTSAVTIGGLVATNQGTLQSCAIRGGTYTSTIKADIGGLVGKNAVAAALVADCKVDGVVTLTVAGQSNLGGLVGTNGAWNSPNIKSSFVGKDVKMIINDISASTAVGGLVGWNCGGIVSGSYSLATIQMSKVANAGGLVGASDGGKVLASYAVGSIVTISGCRAGGLVAKAGDATVTGCYSIITLNTLSGSKVGSLIGEWSSSAMNECYYINSGNAAVAGAGTISSGGTKVAGADDLRSKLDAMNFAISATGFRYVTSTDNNTPLVIQKSE